MKNKINICSAAALICLLFFSVSGCFLRGAAEYPFKKIRSESETESLRNVAVVETEAGSFTFKFFENDAPLTTRNFIDLAKEDFYDGLTFYEVQEDPRLIQGGSPTGDDTGTAGYFIKDEFNPRPHLAGTISMYNRGEPNTASCIFFICLESIPSFNGKFAAFGQIIRGLDVIYRVKKGDKIKSITIQEWPADKVKFEF